MSTSRVIWLGALLTAACHHPHPGAATDARPADAPGDASTDAAPADAGDAATDAAGSGSCPAVTHWSRAFGGSGDDAVAAVASDASGRVAVAGSSTGTFDPGAGALTSAGATDVVVASYAASGTPLWNVRYGGAGRDEALAVAFTPTGDVVIAGRFENTLTIGSTTLVTHGLFDVFVAELDGSDGTPRWAVSFGAAGRDEAFGVAVDATGAVAVVGGFQRSVSFGATTLDAAWSPIAPWTDVFVAKLSGSDGSVTWAKRAGGQVLDLGQAVAFAPNGDVIAAGIVYPYHVDFDGTPFATDGDGTTSGQQYDGFVARLGAADGQLAWVTELPGATVVDARAVAVDPSGEILVGGTLGLIHAGTQEGFQDPSHMFVARVAPGGTVDSVATLGGTATSQAVLGAIAPDGAGGVWIAGGFGGTLDLGAAGTLSATDPEDPIDQDMNYDAFVARVDATGTVTQADGFGGYGDDRVLGMAATPDGVVVGGELAYGFDLCTGTVAMTHGGRDAFVMSVGAASGMVAGSSPPVPPTSMPVPGSCTPPPAPTPPPPAGPDPTYVAADWQGGTIDWLDNDFAAGDFDGDGHEDVAMITPQESTRPGVVLYRNDGTGKFSEATSTMIDTHLLDVEGPASLRALDVDADGKTDLLAVGTGQDGVPYPGAQLRLLVQGAGVMQDRTYGALPIFERWHESVAVGDVDCDGYPEIWEAIGNTAPRLLVNDGHGSLHAEPRITFLPGESPGGIAPVFCDLDRDGAPDLIWASGHGDDPTDIYLHNEGNGELTEVAGVLPMRPDWPMPGDWNLVRAACVDYDRDGWNDVVLLGERYDGLGTAKVFLYHNRGDGTLEDASAAFPALGPAADLRVADLNGDGWVDVIAGRELTGPSEAQVFMNHAGTYVELPGVAPRETGTSILLPIHAASSTKVDLLRIRLQGATPPSVLFAQ